MGGGPDKEILLIVLRYPEPKHITEKIRKRFPHAEVIYYQQQQLEGTTEGQNAESMRVSSKFQPVPKDLFNKATVICTLGGLPQDPKDVPNLQLIQLISAGVDFLSKKPIFTDTDIPICTVSGIHGPPISEWVLMTTLVASRHYNISYENQKNHKWNASPPEFRSATDWVGKTVGIAGYGSIGRQVANVFSSLGANIHAFTASPRSTQSSRRDTGYIIPGTGDPEGKIPKAWYSGHSKTDLHTFLRSGLDMLLISIPLTPATEHLFGAKEFDILDSASKERGSEGCFLVNISRGKLIDQPSLVTALNEGKLRGAALDVTDPEPLPENDPLWNAKNVIIAPHISGLGGEYISRAFDVLMENMRRKQKGEKLLNLVERKRGY